MTKKCPFTQGLLVPHSVAYLKEIGNTKCIGIFSEVLPYCPKAVEKIIKINNKFRITTDTSETYMVFGIFLKDYLAGLTEL